MSEKEDNFYSKGSSRSSSRGHDHFRKSRDKHDKLQRSERKERSRSRERVRSRSPDRNARHAEPGCRKAMSIDFEKTAPSDLTVVDMSVSPNKGKQGSKSSDFLPDPPPPPRISKISMGFNKFASQPTLKAPAIKMNLNVPKVQNEIPSKPKVASVFNDDDDDEEPEEMPAEAKMRMRNIGRETPTSAGPNSYGKTKHGFCDQKKVFERSLKEAMDSDNPPSKLDSIYKVKNS